MPTMMATRRLLTAREAAACRPGGRWELVRGKVVKLMPLQPEEGACVQGLSTAVENHLGGRERALMGPAIGYITVRDPDTVRAPDWSLTWREEARARHEGAWIAGVPNLAVEVVSPDDRWIEVQEAVDEYLESGTQLVWVLQPAKQTIHVIRPDAPVKTLRPGDELTGGPVLTGFRIPVEQLLPAPAAA